MSKKTKKYKVLVNWLEIGGKRYYQGDIIEVPSHGMKFLRIRNTLKDLAGKGTIKEIIKKKKSKPKKAVTKIESEPIKIIDE